ncbi:hypothetical protein H310_05021 [Aphanomyces invadans]|uniref:Peptidase C1A papain C-terminal domain-containing protein n=1 Tax=Aphanomyces invadans TaxID=157072 RepID=A0A024UDB0_9STRA|nr:hypothetical protein H310_05021 [Aphanomyces invadans]ETW03618.1 hypothetical protein H310_05021 [Aphanomyces invadans]|eukprot:XP_008867847.1 hypothetical protein H310_05021 [Aphanomyces invadans]
MVSSRFTLPIAVASFGLTCALPTGAELSDLTAELEAWRASRAGQVAKAHGFLPRLESTTAELTRFYETKQDVERLNLLHPDAKFSMDSPFSLLSTTEFKTIMTRSVANQTAATLVAGRSADVGSSAVPPSRDWMTSGCVNSVQQQGQCGSCWAFATISAVETAMCLASPTKSLVKLSEQQLTSCDTATGNMGCQGGYPTKAIDYVASAGVCLLEDYPYVSGSTSQNESCSTSCAMTATGVKKAVSVAAGDISLVSTLQQRTVVAGVAAGNNEWKQYKSGVLNSCSTSALDHAVVVVGYTDSHWKIKNSWGEEWGDQGFIYLRRTRTNTDGTCGVTSEASYPSLV